jgi:uncharacterized protein
MMSWVGRKVAVALIHAYQVLTAWVPRRCRYEPTCSAYAIGSIEAFGLIRGGWLAIRRIGSCHPWSAGGIDPVPATPVRQSR